VPRLNRGGKTKLLTRLNLLMRMPRSLALIDVKHRARVALGSEFVFDLPMPRFKLRRISRALYLLLVVCTLYYLTVELWSTNAGIDYGRADPAADVLEHVNMFIGTKNGGETYEN
jgi:hypothetical protein